MPKNLPKAYTNLHRFMTASRAGELNPVLRLIKITFSAFCCVSAELSLHSYFYGLKYVNWLELI